MLCVGGLPLALLSCSSERMTPVAPVAMDGCVGTDAVISVPPDRAATTAALIDGSVAVADCWDRLFYSTYDYAPSGGGTRVYQHGVRYAVFRREQLPTAAVYSGRATVCGHVRVLPIGVRLDAGIRGEAAVRTEFCDDRPVNMTTDGRLTVYCGTETVSIHYGSFGGGEGSRVEEANYFERAYLRLD